MVPAVAVLGGAWQAWPAFALPLVVAMPLCGASGLVVSGSATALVLALLTGREEVDGTSLVVGLGAFCAAGLVAGLAHQASLRRLESAERHSVTDRLTGLSNYAYFSDALVRECRRSDRYGLPLSLVLLDLDRFKEFNDRYGHEPGNRLLAEVGSVIRASLRSSDLAARYGGEELAILVQGTAREALEVAERIRAAVSRVRVRVAGGGQVGTTVSAGVAEYPPGAGDADLLLDQADKALYAAKGAGRDQVRLFAPEHRWARAGVA